MTDAFVTSCCAVILRLQGWRSSLKLRVTERMNRDWWASGSSPWYLRLAWRLLAPFLRGA